MLASTSRSDFLRVRGLRYHVRRWGDPAKPMVFLGHGFLDVSATFEPLVAALLEFTGGAVQVLAPDWRGFGHTDWGRDDGYWFSDYVGDFHFIARHYSPEAPLTLVGHSMAAQSSRPPISPRWEGCAATASAVTITISPSRSLPPGGARTASTRNSSR